MKEKTKPDIQFFMLFMVEFFKITSANAVGCAEPAFDSPLVENCTGITADKLKIRIGFKNHEGREAHEEDKANI